MLPVAFFLLVNHSFDYYFYNNFVEICWLVWCGSILTRCRSYFEFILDLGLLLVIWSPSFNAYGLLALISVLRKLFCAAQTDAHLQVMLITWGLMTWFYGLMFFLTRRFASQGSLPMRMGLWVCLFLCVLAEGTGCTKALLGKELDLLKEQRGGLGGWGWGARGR